MPCRNMFAIRALLGSLCLGLIGSGLAFSAPPAATLVEKENLVEAQPRGAAWRIAEVGAELATRDRLRTGEYSRAALRFADRSILRVDELTTLEVSQPAAASSKKTIDVQRGGIFLHHRDRPQDLEIRTPAANGAIRGTEFALRVAASGRTTLTMLDGEVELSNAQGRVRLRSGEQGEVEVGRAPRKTAVIDAVQAIQWCLYYPGVVDPAVFGAGGAALAAYRAGDLPGALRSLPRHEGDWALRAAVILPSGQVEKARALLRGVPSRHPARRALERTIAAVQGREWTGGEAESASEWLAESYYRQSRDRLAEAREAARRATELSPDFGFAWVRLAELEFPFGRTAAARAALEHGLALAPRNAQAAALRGFLLSAENRTEAARRAFDEAIALDGALGNAWLGRGLVAIRQGRETEGRFDLQTAAALEPQRSLLRSYLGKAFTEAGENAPANAELDRASALDPNDPTPWLYRALQRQQENRDNEAIADLERSIELNDQRGVYRSRFLLDQDRAVRDANLAAIYRRSGMIEESVREAIRGLASDYTSASAHLFLAESYDALRDPQRIRLRYEPAWLSELLLAQMLAPVGGGSLSQFVSQHEYSKLFESDGPRLASVAEYRSNGEIRANASLFGTTGNLSYALDAEYFYNDGLRPSNRLARFGLFGSFKLQLGPQDTLLFRVRTGDLRSGDVFQRYDPQDASTVAIEQEIDGVTQTVRIPNRAGLTFSAHEEQDPGLALLGWHREWAPGQHTLLLLGRLANEYTVTAEDVGVPVLYANVFTRFPFLFSFEVGNTIPRDDAFFDLMERQLGKGVLSSYATSNFDLDFRADLLAHSAELQHIATVGPMTFIGGVRYQAGDIETRVRLTDPNNGQPPEDLPLYRDPPARQDYSVDYQRLNLYLYDIWKVAPWLSLTAGVTYDRLEYPENFLSPPVTAGQDTLEKVLPKAGLILQPWRGATIRAAYAEALGGASFDEGVRLEPSQVAGFTQVHRNLVSESLVGSVTGSAFRLTGLSLEQKLPSRTYLGLEYANLEQDVDRTIGAFEGMFAFTVLAFLPTSLDERLRYREQNLAATIHQLVGDRWAFGLRYRYTHSELDRELDGVEDAARRSQDPPTVASLARNAHRHSEAHLHELLAHATYQHPGGFFARAEARWFHQDNDELETTATLRGPAAGSYRTDFSTREAGLPSEDFWHFNVFAGWRFLRNRCEVSCGVLNLTDQDYRLNPLNPYEEFVRERTYMVRCRLNF
jgi:tetratricopeptide (TPR) repeat protein